MLDFFPPQLIFEKEGVYLHTNAKRSNQETTIPGFIRIVERVSKSLSQVCSDALKEIRRAPGLLTMSLF